MLKLEASITLNFYNWSWVKIISVLEQNKRQQWYAKEAQNSSSSADSGKEW